MAPYWEPGTQYNYGDVVQYEGIIPSPMGSILQPGHRYKIIQPHCSQGDWAPGPATAALWGRLSDDDNNYGGDNKQQQNYQQPPNYQQQQQQGQHDQQSQNQQQNNEPPKPEEKKNWYGDEETKKKLEIGGGLAAGAALLAGGLFAYKKHEEHKEEAKADDWAHGNWIQEARARRDNYHRNGSYEPATWILTDGQNIPKGALLIGREKTWNLYSCRAFFDGGIQLGKASEGFTKGGVLAYKNKEVFVNEYEVLVGDMSGLHWESSSGTLNPASLRYRPVEAGRDGDGTPLYVAEAPYKGAIHPGKAGPGIEGAIIPHDGKEKNIREYRVLCYNN